MSNTNQAAFTFLATGDHEVIIYSALKKLGMSPRDSEYQDFVQEGWLLFANIYNQYPDDPWQHRKPFLAYARLALYRRFLNMKTRASATRETIYDQQTMAEQLEASKEAADIEAAVAEAHQLEEWLARCDGVGQRYLIDTVVHGLNVTEIAKKWRVSRQTVYGWRKKVQQNLIELYERRQK